MIKPHEKNLTTMIAAATALLGMSACNDSNNSNNSSKKPLEPITPAAFAGGFRAYSITAQGATCRLQGSNGQAGDTTADIPALGGYFILSRAHQDYYCAMRYKLGAQENATEATLTLSFRTADIAKLEEDEAFRSFWQIPEGSELKDSDTYEVTFAFPGGTAKMSRNDAEVGVGTFEVLTFELPTEDAAASAQP